MTIQNSMVLRLQEKTRDMAFRSEDLPLTLMLLPDEEEAGDAFLHLGRVRLYPKPERPIVFQPYTWYNGRFYLDREHRQVLIATTPVSYAGVGQSVVTNVSMKAFYGYQLGIANKKAFYDTLASLIPAGVYLPLGPLALWLSVNVPAVTGLELEEHKERFSDMLLSLVD